MATTYCNINSDLVDVHRDIERYNMKRTLTGWEQVAGAVYKLDQSGYVEVLFEDGVALTDGGDTTPDAGEFYYDENTNTLYVQTVGSTAPSGHTMQSGVDWDAFKTECRNDAQEQLEALLRKVFAVPFQKIAEPEVSYNSRKYDYYLRRMTATLTCSNIIKRQNVENQAWQTLYREVHNPKDNDEFANDDPPGIVQQILSGDIHLRHQRTAREAGGWNVFETLDSSSTGILELYGDYNGSWNEVWRVQIDTAGAPGTATYKVSFDGGTTFDETLQEIRDSDSDNQRVHLGDGIYARFTGTFVLNDYFDIHLFPSTDKVSVAGIGNIRLTRNG